MSKALGNVAATLSAPASPRDRAAFRTPINDDKPLNTTPPPTGSITASVQQSSDMQSSDMQPSDTTYQPDRQPSASPAATDPPACPAQLTCTAQPDEIRRLMLNAKFGIDQLMTKIQIIWDEFRHMHDESPIEHVGSRLKSWESIQRKGKRRGIALDPATLAQQMYDIAGVRVTCSFVSDIYRVRDMLVEQLDIELVEVRDYIANPKSTGYKSLHLLVKTPVYLPQGLVWVPVEIQLRTVAMDFWASLEHKIRYKYDCDVPRHLADSLVLAAEVAWSLDTSMERIADEVKLSMKDREPVTERVGFANEAFGIAPWADFQG
ncbi:MAG: GTP pyrophosphokinase family protein [Cellulomonadaceae bacterium]|nr:GTP pyrophosphokinase family protein [Cellulomonadaceae bacterium]